MYSALAEWHMQYLRFSQRYCLIFSSSAVKRFVVGKVFFSCLERLTISLSVSTETSETARQTTKLQGNHVQSTRCLRQTQHQNISSRCILLSCTRHYLYLQKRFSLKSDVNLLSLDKVR